MPTYREVNTGQVVTVEVEPNHLSGLARWERIEEELRAPEPAAVVLQAGEVVVAAADVAEQAQAALVQAQAEAVEQIADLNAELADSAADAPATLAVEVEGVHEASPAVPAKPDEDANKPVWIAYAKANGKTDADLKGKTKPEIIAWFA